MSFATTEASLASGVPYELHEFRLGETSTYWRYADAPADVEYSGNTFSACYCRGSRIEQGSTALKSRTTVSVDWENPFAWLYTVAAPEDIVHYTRYKGHGADVQAIFMGDVVDVVFRQESRKGDRWAEIVIDPLTASLRRAGLIQRYSRQCDACLFDLRCGLDRDDYEVTGTIDSVSGNTLTSVTFGSQDYGWWTGGDIVVNGRRRKVVSHIGNDIIILPSASGVAAGQTFQIWPGCDHLYATCRDKFSNSDNYLGQIDIPDLDPSRPWGIL